MNSTLLIILGVVAAAGIGILLLGLPLVPAGSNAGGEASSTPADAPALATPVESAPEVAMDEGTPSDPPVEDTVVSTAEAIPAPATPAVDGLIDAEEYAHAVEIADVQVHWTNDAETLWVGLESPGAGYVSMGFDPEQRMKGANFIIGYVDDGAVEIRDDFGIAPISHGPDVDNGGEENILEAAGREEDGRTVLEFAIPLDSGDPTDKPLVPGETYGVLVAYHGSSDGFGVRHSTRGSGEITLDALP